MNFASAFICLQRGHKIKRKHWTGYWALEDNEIIMHTKDGIEMDIRTTDRLEHKKEA